MEDRRPLIFRGAVIALAVTFPFWLLLGLAGRWLAGRLLSVL